MRVGGKKAYRCWTQPWFWLLAGSLALSFFLNFWNIGQNGTGNAYYAAAIKSMTQNWHNFFYVSFDPAGMVSVDKPPLGLWVQALFCKVFGYSGWAMLLPQALAGMACCLMLYLLVTRPFGRPAGLLAALCFALTPAVVTVSRNNTIDMQLIFLLLIAVWFLMKAIRTGKWRWLMLCGLFIGLGFNVKMMQAYLIFPAVGLVYLFFAKGKCWKRFAALGLSVAVMLAVSFAWVAAVDLTPASERPYVDSTSNNSMLELVFGHNGSERLFGQSSGGGKSPGNGSNQPMHQNIGQNDQTDRVPPSLDEDRNGYAATIPDPSQLSGELSANSAIKSEKNGNQLTNSGDLSAQDGDSEQTQPPDGRQNGAVPSTVGGGNPGKQNAGIGGSMDIGNASAFRLWNDALYGQGSWLLLFAIAALIVALRRKYLKQKHPQQVSLVFWGFWLATAGVFFSVAGFFHSYYLCMMAPPIAALSGIGLSQLFCKKQEMLVPALPATISSRTVARLPDTPMKPSRWEVLRPWMLFAALIANIAISAGYVYQYSSVRTWLLPVILAPGIVGAILFLLTHARPQKVLKYLSAVLLVISLLAGSAYWAWTPTQVVSNATIPTAGPTNFPGASGMSGFSGQQPGQHGDSSVSPPSDDSGGSASAQMPSGGGVEGTSSVGLESYLLAHYVSGSFLLTANRADDVAQLIVDTGLPCYAYGGFLGNDNSMTVEKLKQLVKEGKVTYFLVSGQGGVGGSDDITSYVEENAQKIDASEYGGSSGTASALYRFS